MLETAIPLLSGAFAGLAVDLSLFPIDTLKTRLQAKGGFFQNGGYRGIYKGMGSIAAGSAPGAALFFVCYETCKERLPIENPMTLIVTAGCIAETMACIIRNPTEVVKQRTQTSSIGSSLQTLKTLLAQDGIPGFYRGFVGTLARELPFVAIQYPLWEKLKTIAVAERGATQPHALDQPVLPKATPAEAAICGAVAGGVAAACTTPMDVVKTRLMLATHRMSWFGTFRTIVKEEGLMALTKGMVPRVGWISAGGFIFLGGYSTATEVLERLLRH